MSGKDGLNMAEALNRALHEAMQDDDTTLVIGEDVGVDGGVFRITDGLLERFGEDRVIDAPVAESGIIGVSLGMAMNGLRPIAEMQFSGFSYMGLAQVENHVSRIRWRTRGRFSAPMVIRMPYGAGVHALEHHSESREVFYAHMPGLKTVIPATPARARALLHAAVQDPDPVVFMEPKAVYRAGREEVPETAEPAELGRARTAREGDAATIVSWGAMLSRALEAAETAAEEDGVEAEVLDLETIAPIDAEAIAASVSRTGRLLVVDEAPRSYGPAGEIVMRAAEGDFYALRAAPRRVTGWDVHVPYFAREQAYLPDAGRITRALRAVVSEG